MKYIVITRTVPATALLASTGDGETRMAGASPGSAAAAAGGGSAGSSATTISDGAVRALCVRLHQIYADAVSNPFYTVGEELGDAYERKARQAVIDVGSSVL